MRQGIVDYASNELKYIVNYNSLKGGDRLKVNNIYKKIFVP